MFFVCALVLTFLIKGKLAHLVLKKDAVPKFLPARTVPIAKGRRCANLWRLQAYS